MPIPECKGSGYRLLCSTEMENLHLGELPHHKIHFSLQGSAGSHEVSCYPTGPIKKDDLCSGCAFNVEHSALLTHVGTNHFDFIT